MKFSNVYHEIWKFTHNNYKKIIIFLKNIKKKNIVKQIEQNSSININNWKIMITLIFPLKKKTH